MVGRISASALVTLRQNIIPTLLGAVSHFRFRESKNIDTGNAPWETIILFSRDIAITNKDNFRYYRIIPD